ncbi:SecY-interacting protein, partial [Paraferrimonas sp. SM1919]|uniref:SecY-interacting protein n=1 Tax=Paraferrimonas sp. SM1919 TaxID=2662263 RepID=UPI0013CFED31
MADHPLASWLSNYVNYYQQQANQLPLHFHFDETSPAQVSKINDMLCHWQPHLKTPIEDFADIGRGLELDIHPNLALIYGSYYGGPLYFDSQFGKGHLLQVWNDEDLIFLKENLISHGLMKTKLKQPVTFFVGTLDNGDENIVIDNHNGYFYLEVPGQEPHQLLAENVPQLLAQISPRLVLEQQFEQQLEQPPQANMG